MYIFLIMEVFTFQANINSTNWKLVSAILVGALYPNIVQVMKPSSKFSQGSTGKDLPVHVCKVIVSLMYIFIYRKSYLSYIYMIS